VDLVVIDRVGTRHADALLDEAERCVLERYGKLRPALAWALKEAGAKASGDPMRRFPDGLGIEMSGVGLIVRAGGMSLAARWEMFGEFLCGWVWTESS
jgi:phosphopantetheinyl transferase (holo-ACP synthase)